MEATNGESDLRHTRSKAFLSARDGNLATFNSVLENLEESNKETILTRLARQCNQLCNPLIIAAANDHFSIVELLGRKYKQYVGVNKAGNVYIKQCLRKNVTSLGCAAINGNLEMVQFLVEELNANVNHRSQYNVTPVRDACAGGYIKIVKYLVSRGADLFLKHAYDQSTCLIEAISHGHFEVAEFLLDEGLDPNIQTSDTGMTALHFACRQNSDDIAKSLVCRGAVTTIKDTRGLTAVDHACEACNDDIVRMFEYTSKIELQKEDVVRSLELLGASYIINNKNHIMGFYFAKRGMEKRFNNPAEVLYKSGLIMVENDGLIYGDRRESFTVEEIEELEGNPDGQKNEAILMMERILGENNFLCPEVVIKDFCTRASNYEGISRYMDALTILIKVLNIREITQKSNWQVVEQFVELFAQMQHVEHILDPAVVTHVFDKCLTDLEQEWLKYQYVDYEPISEQAMETVSKQVRNVFNLMAVMKCLIKEGEDYLGISLARFVSRFLDIDLFIDPFQRASPLHIACSGVSAKFQQLRSPNFDVIELLLEKGADINATDHDGNTPLHVLASYNGSDDKAVFDVTMLFTQSGAHLDARNKEGLRSLDLANPVIVDELKHFTKKVPLKCMAAQTVKLYLRNYEEVLPPSLYKFVEQH